MSSISKFLGDICCCCCSRDPSDALYDAGLKAWKKYDETQEQRYLEKAIQNHRSALDIRISEHPHRPESLYHTAAALWAQCQLGAVTKENSSVVISYYEEALRLLPWGDKAGHRAIVYNNLGQVYFSLFRLGQENSEAFPVGPNLNKAIENHRSALELRSAKDDPNRPRSLINLSIALVQEGSEADLTHAITYLGEAVELCSAKASSRNSLLLSLNSLAAAYDSRYYYSEDINDVVGKVDALRKVLGLVTDEGKARLIPLLNLTNALWRLCEIVPNRGNDINEAVRCGQEALQLSNNYEKSTHVKVLITLANVLTARYTQSNPKNVTDLSQAIQYYRDAIDPDPEDGPDPILCSSLASAIYVRCQDFGEMDGVTLEDAISYNQEASHACPKDDPLYLKIQNNLGSIYLTRFNKLGGEGDLIKGIQSYEDVVAHCPADNEDYAYYRDTLKEAKRVLQDKREGRTDKPLSALTTIRRTRSMTRTIRSRSSSGHSISRSSTPESRKRESFLESLTPLAFGPP